MIQIDFKSNGPKLLKFEINKTIISFKSSVIQKIRNPYDLLWALVWISAEWYHFPTPLSTLTSMQVIIQIKGISENMAEDEIIASRLECL